MENTCWFWDKFVIGAAIILISLGEFGFFGNIANLFCGAAVEDAGTEVTSRLHNPLRTVMDRL